ncbi:ATP-binding cassette domain-containing protein [Actinomadura madurae]|uniref:ATP-binding cassette domain-containing protein n=1 Tax=Actinomadura madurae TaxID=1993 RepID=UPI00399A70BD
MELGQESMVVAEGLCKDYRTTPDALAGVSLSIPRGTVMGLLGSNGAGKTTLMRVLTTQLTPDSGRATVAGFDIIRQPHEIRRRIGVSGQYTALDDQLTGRENVELFGRLARVGRRELVERAGQLLERFELGPIADHRVRTYSGGTRRRLDLAICTIAQPQVLFLDEPTAGLDPRGRLLLWAFVRELVADGVTVLLTSQYLGEIDALAHQVAVIDRGRVIAEGTPDGLKRQVGGERLEVTLVHPADISTALKAVFPYTVGRPNIDASRSRISVGLDGGVKTAAAAIHALATVHVEVSQFALRSPSLEEAFFDLTEQDCRS